MKALITFLFATLLSSQAFAYSYIGIGVTFEKKEKSSPFATIIKTIPGAPADKAGITAGNTIWAVDGKKVEGLSVEDVAKLIAGDAGAKVTLSIAESVEVTNYNPVDVVRELIQVECFMEGNVSLRAFGDKNSGTVYGRVGNEYVSWTYSFGFLRGYYKGEGVNLNIRQDMNSNYVTISGWVHNTYVTWRGFNNFISGYEECVP